MMTVNEVSEMTGLSVRALQYYDKIGLLKPAEHTKAGYRLYDETCMCRLQMILLYKELDFPLKEIKKILDAPDYDGERILEQQIKLLAMRKEHIEKLIDFAEEMRKSRGKGVDFTVFDNEKMNEYEKQAKEMWGDTDSYKEYEKKAGNMSVDEKQDKAKGLMTLFAEFGGMKNLDPSSEIVQLQVRKLQNHISDNYYQCTDKILGGLGVMYAAGGEFTDNIDNAGGKGTAEFTAKAIEHYVRQTNGCI